MRLQSMTSFVLQQKEKYNSENEPHMWDYLRLHFRYAEFLSQPLTLGIFVPVDEEGNVLEKPKNYEIAEPIIKSHLNHKAGKKKENEYKFHAYKKAKEKVLFEGFEVKSYKDDEENTIEYVGTLFKRINNGEWIPDNTVKIERLANQEIYLTPSALKQIGITK